MTKKDRIIVNIFLGIILLGTIILTILLINEVNKVDKLKKENAVLKVENKVLKNDYWDLISGLGECNK